MEISDAKFINPETAAHNIATAICNQSQIPLSKIDFNDIGASDVAIQDVASSVADLYAYAYDAAFDKIQKYNATCEDD